MLHLHVDLNTHAFRLSRGETRSNDNVHRSSQIQRYNNSPPYTWPSKWPLPHSVNTGVKRNLMPPFKFLGGHTLILTVILWTFCMKQAICTIQLCHSLGISFYAIYNLLNVFISLRTSSVVVCPCFLCTHLVCILVCMARQTSTKNPCKKIISKKAWVWAKTSEHPRNIDHTHTIILNCPV